MANISFSQGIFETGSAKNDGEMGDRPRAGKLEEKGHREGRDPPSPICLCKHTLSPLFVQHFLRRRPRHRLHRHGAHGTRAQRLSHVLILAAISISSCPGVRTRAPAYPCTTKEGRRRDGRANEGLEKAGLLLLRLSRRQTWYTHKAEAHRPRPAATDRQRGRNLSKTRARRRGCSVVGSNLDILFHKLYSLSFHSLSNHQKSGAATCIFGQKMDR